MRIPGVMRWGRVLVAGVLAALCLCPLGSDGSIEVSQEAADAYKKAVSAQRRGSFAEAEKGFRAALKDSPAFPHALVGIAEVMTDTGRIKEAEKAYREALKEVPTFSPALGGLGFLLLQQGKAEEAEEVFTQVVKLNPQSTAALLNLGAAQKSSGKVQQAADTFRGILAIDGTEEKAAYNLGNTMYLLQKHDQAVEAYKLATSLSPAHADAYNNMANALKDSGKPQEALESLEFAVEASPGNMAALTNLGSMYTDAGRIQDALRILTGAEALAPDVAQVIGSLGNTLLAANRTSEAIEKYRRAVDLAPQDPVYHRALGDALSVVGEAEEAERSLTFAAQAAEGLGEGPEAGASFSALGALRRKMNDLEGAVRFYRKAIDAEPQDWSHHMNLGVVLADAHRSMEALPHLRKASELKPKDPLILSNLGTVLHRTAMYDESILMYRTALAISPDSPNLHYNLANSFLDAGIQTEFQLLNYAVNEYTTCLSLEVTFPGGLNNLGNALKEQDRFRDALRAWVAALRLEGRRSPDVFSNLVHLRMFSGDWKGWDRRYDILRDILETQLSKGTNETVSCQPFHALLYPPFHPDLVLRVAANYAMSTMRNVEHYPRLPLPSWSLKGSTPRLRVGYVSHDFGDHPTGHLFSSVPSLHLKHSRIQATYYSLRGDDSSSYFSRLKRDLPPHAIVDIASLAYDDAARLINSHGNHILIDLDVWMKGRRPEIFAMRPCAVQMVYLGYPGSSGAPYIDHIVSDPIVSPPEVKQHYSEAFLLLSGTYQVNDYKHTFASVHTDVEAGVEGTRRSDFGLPEESVLLGNMNQLYKIDPQTLNLWSNVVRSAREKVDAKLWVLRFPALAAKRIEEEWQKRGMGERDLVFSDRLGKSEHLRRMHLADVFLDNHHVNAHTTASEALWAGVPVVTWPGQGMASRVASSLIAAIGLKNMLTAFTEEDFVRLGVAIAQNRKWRQALRDKIRKDRMSGRLFDTDGWVKGMESAMQRAWDAAAEGKIQFEHVSADT